MIRCSSDPTYYGKVLQRRYLRSYLRCNLRCNLRSYLPSADAGHYVPHIADYIIQHGDESRYSALRKRFAGVGLGEVK